MSDQTFTHRSADGLTVTATLRLNPVHSAIVNLLSRQERPLVTLAVVNDGDAARTLRIGVGVDRYSDEDVETLTVDAGGAQRADYLPPFDTAQLATLNELTRANLRIRIDDLEAGKSLLEKTLPLHLLAINAAPIAALDPATGQYIDQSRYLGAFVTPNDPEMDALLKAATQYLPDGQRFDGYRSHALGQVQAIYAALAQREIHYADATLDFNPDAKAQATQRVRLPKQALVAKLANCIDGTLLLAALLERVGIEPAIVVMPHHALVGWRERPDGDWRYLETTALGLHPFAKAVEIGTTKANAYAQGYEQTGDAGYFRRWPLRDLRAQGITPISVTAGDEMGRLARALEAIGEQGRQPGMSGISIGEIHAINVGETQTIDQRHATFVTGRNITADRIENSNIQTGDHAVNTDGGAYVGGSVTAGRDFVGRDQIVGGRQSVPAVNRAFTQLAAGIAQKASSVNVGRAMQLVTEMEEALARGDDDKVADCIGDLAKLAPGAKESLRGAFARPPLSEQVGPAAKYVLRRLR